MLANYLDLIVNRGKEENKEEKTKVKNKKNNLKKFKRKKNRIKYPPPKKNKKIIY